MPIRRATKWSLAILLVLFVLGAAGFVTYRTWPRGLHAPAQTRFTSVFFANGRMGIAMPADSLVADFGAYGNTLNTFLYLDLIRSRKPIDSTRVMACSSPTNVLGPSRIYLQVDNDMLASLPYLYSLRSSNFIREFTLYGWTNQDLNRCKDSTVRLDATFRVPASTPLQQIPDAQLIGPMADFLMFKALTDRRVLFRTADPPIPVLQPDQARELAGDMIVVARFYNLPLDYFLGIGAVENNYMNIIGDLGHAVWKRKPDRGDVIIERRRRMVLVRNYALGVWQITRETLRKTQAMYLEDRKTRDYSVLPERLQPQVDADLDNLQPETLTTYAGLLLRNLLNHFNGDVMQAAGAYNAGIQRPNANYAQSVRNVATYARTVLTHSIPVAAPASPPSGTTSPPPS